MAKEKFQLYELFNFFDGNDDILGDMPPQDAINTRRGMWAQIPYSVDDGGDNSDAVINEQFIDFVSNREYYPSRALTVMPYLMERFNECVGNLKEVLNHAKNPKRFYENLIKLQEYLIEQNSYDGEPLSMITEEDEQSDIRPPIMGYEVMDDIKYVTDLANAVTEKLRIARPQKDLGGGSKGRAFLINDNLVMKITSDVSEADAGFKIMRNHPKTLAEVFEIYKLIDTETKYSFFVLFEENIKDKPTELFKQYDRLIMKIMPKEMYMGDVWVLFKKRREKLAIAFDEIRDLPQRVITDNPDAGVDLDTRKKLSAFISGIFAIKDELVRLGINSNDFSRYENLGYKNGVLTYFDVGDYKADEPTFGDKNTILLPEGQENLTEEYDRQTADEIAMQVAQQKGLGNPTYMRGGRHGIAYDIGNDRVLKITKDKSEAVENLKLIDKKLKYVAEIFHVYEVKSKSHEIPDTYAIVLEKLDTDTEIVRRYDRLEYAFEKIMDVKIPDVIEHYLEEWNHKEVNKEKINSYFKKNPQDAEFFGGLLRIAEESKAEGIDSYDFLNPLNLGYKKNGALAFFDVGSGTDYFEPKGAEQVVVDEDGSAKFSTPDAIGQDGFPPYDNTGDSSQPIRNNLDANSAMYNEDLEYNHVDGDATQDEYMLTESRADFLSWKRKNVTIRGMQEVGKENNGMASFGQGLYTAALGNKELARKYGKVYFVVGAIPKHPKIVNTWNDAEIFLQNVVVQYGKKNSIDNYYDAKKEFEVKTNVRDEMLELGYDGLIIKGREMVNYTPEDIRYFETEQELESYYDSISNDINERDKSYGKGSQTVTVKKKCQLGGNGDGTSTACNQGDISNLELGSINEAPFSNYQGKDVFMNPQVINRLADDARGWLDRDGNLYMIDDGYNLTHSALMFPLLAKGLIDAEDVMKYMDSDKGLAVQKVGNTNFLAMSDAYKGNAESKFNQFKSAIDMAVKRNPKIRFIGVNHADAENLDLQVLRTKVMQTQTIDEDIDASEAHYDEDALQTVINGRRGVALIGFGETPIMRTMVDGARHKQRAIDAGLNLIPIKQSEVSHQGLDMNIVYRNGFEKQARRLYDIMMSHGGYVADKTPEEAREIGKIFDYTEDSIEDYVRRKYPETLAPVEPSPEDYYDFAENLEVSENIDNIASMNEAEILSLQDLPFKDEVEQLGGKIYSVGGAVRDEFLGLDSKDLDILVTGIPLEELQAILAKYGRVSLEGESFGILKFKPEGATEDIDVAIPRTDAATGGGGHKDVETKSDHELPIEKDLERRDITINAMAKDMEGNLIDPYGGEEDLKNKIIRAVNPDAFNDDPLRMLRAVQFGSRFGGFGIEPKTMQMIKDTAPAIKNIAPERILTEFEKIITKGNPRVGVELLVETGLFKQIFGNQILPSQIGRRDFEGVRTMAELLFLMMDGVVQNPAEFFLQRFATDKAKKAKIYKEMLALNEAFNSDLITEPITKVNARSVTSNMFKKAPQSLESQILPEAIETAAQELLQGKYPKNEDELAANGNDLKEIGITNGNDIGKMKKSLLIKIYADIVRNNREDLLALAKENAPIVKEYNSYPSPMNEGVLNEMSINSISFDNIVTPQYIEELKRSDNYERYLEYFKYEYHLEDQEDGELEQHPEFEGWLRDELYHRYDTAVDNIGDVIKPDGTIDIWREMTVDENWLKKLPQSGKHLGIYWSWDEAAAEAHWGHSGGLRVQIKSSVREEHVNWHDTIILNMDISLGEEEKEIRLFKNTELKIEEMYVDGKYVMDTPEGNILKDKTFLAEEEIKNIAYSAVVLTDESHAKLLKVFGKMIPEGWKPYAHHMTIKMGKLETGSKEEEDMDNKELITLTVLDYAIDDLVIAVGVEGYPTNNAKPHITLAVNIEGGGKPFFSNKLTDWKPIGFPLKLTGIVTEVPR